MARRKKKDVPAVGWIEIGREGESIPRFAVIAADLNFTSRRDGTRLAVTCESDGKRLDEGSHDGTPSSPTLEIAGAVVNFPYENPVRTKHTFPAKNAQGEPSGSMFHYSHLDLIDCRIEIGDKIEDDYQVEVHATVDDPYQEDDRPPITVRAELRCGYSWAMSRS